METKQKPAKDFLPRVFIFWLWQFFRQAKTKVPQANFIVVSSVFELISKSHLIIAAILVDGLGNAVE